MSLLTKQRHEQAAVLKRSIKWVIKVRETWSPREIRVHLLHDYGTNLSLRAVQNYVKELKTEQHTKETIERNTVRLQEKTERKEIKKAKVAEKKREYPVYITSPCEHRVRLKLTDNPNQSGMCGNCGCSYDRRSGKWYDRFTGNKWGFKPERECHVTGGGGLHFTYD